VGTALLEVAGVLVGALDEGDVVLVEVVGVGLRSATDDDVQPARSSAAAAASAAMAAPGTFIRVATPPSRGEDSLQLGTESNSSATLG